MVVVTELRRMEMKERRVDKQAIVDVVPVTDEDDTDEDDKDACCRLEGFLHTAVSARSLDQQSKGVGHPE